MANVGYTPDGVPKAPGFNNPDNPYDTGRPGEKNTEKNNGVGGTPQGWNRDTQTWDGTNNDPTRGGGGIPGAGIIGQMVAQGLAEYKKALARLNQNRQNTLTQYGYAGDIDAESGSIKNMRVDSSNPYGIYQKLRRGNAQSFEGLRDASMERGLGRRGLGAQGVSNARWQWGEADTSMAQALTGTMSGYDETQQSAWQAYQNLLWQAQLEAARNAQPGGYDGGDYGDDGGGGGGGDDGGYQGDTRYGGEVPTANQLNRARAAQQQTVAKKPPTRVTQNKKPGQAGFRPY